MKKYRSLSLYAALLLAVGLLIFSKRWSISILLGYAFCFLNLSILFSSMEKVISECQNKAKETIVSSICRLLLLGGFAVILVKFHEYLSIIGIGIGMVISLIGYVLDKRK